MRTVSTGSDAAWTQQRKQAEHTDQAMAGADQGQVTAPTGVAKPAANGPLTDP